MSDVARRPGKPPRLIGRRRVLRWAVLTVAATECLAALALLAILLGSGGGDPLGREIARGVAMITALVAALTAVPAFILALLDCWLPLALVLSAAGPLAWLAFMRNA
jgi:hypothetical protein